ncbi:hypothetical protein JOB18_028327 [Solea senegalensis]|uniref:Coilin n=1 Tax=Solea senegalensis TaxID=28829 RepID=A0AAV6RLT4_SOLSE|nr:coilin [Solea senegalensis]KAG7505290.1 hypothetical protein JOB18_028327 [Solea senegalensis]
MAANSNSFIRVRLFFDYPPPAIADCRMCWLLVDLNACRVVSDLESLIREKFEFSSRSILNLFVDDCYLPHTESVFVVRDNDSVRVKVDSLAQVNGHSSSPDPSSKNCRKRHRPAEDDGVSVEWKEKKRKKKREESLEREAKQVSGGKKSKKSKDKHAEKKKKKKEKTEDNIPVTPKSTAAAKKPPSTVEQPVKSIKKLPAVQGKTQSKKQIVSSSDSSSSSSEEHEAPKKTPALKPAAKTPSSTPAASKTPVAASKTPVAASKTPVAASKTPVAAASKTPVATSKTPVATKPTQKKSQPTPSSSSETDSSSDEAAGAKVPPKHKPWNSTSQTSKPQQAPSLPPSSDCAQKKAAPEATPPPDGKDVETPKSDEEEEEEIQLVIRQPLQQPWRGMGVRPPWSGGSCGRTGSGGLGGRGRGEGRGLSRGHAADSFESSYNGAKEPSYQTDLLSNKSVILQNGAEVAPKKDYSSMPLLAAPPQVGQKIAFKLLELTENYTPEVSEYKEGRIVSFDPTTKQIELEILTVTQAPVEPGKFDLVYQNADGSESVEYAVPRGAWVTERWDSLLEPRLLM